MLSSLRGRRAGSPGYAGPLERREGLNVGTDGTRDEGSGLPVLTGEAGRDEGTREKPELMKGGLGLDGLGEASTRFEDRTCEVVS